MPSSAVPGAGDWLEDEARGLKSAGIDVVVSLLESAEARQFDLASEEISFKAAGLGFVSFPIRDRAAPASPAAAAELIATLTRELDAGRSVAIHCRQSVGRSGMIAAALLANAGIEPERAIELVSEARGQTIPETAVQRSWILRLRASASLPF